MTLWSVDREFRRVSGLFRHVRERVAILLSLIADAMRYGGLCLRPSPVLAAENLFLRKQLALYQERQEAPPRLVGGGIGSREVDPWRPNHWTESLGSAMLAWEAPLSNGVILSKTVIPEERLPVNFDVYHHRYDCLLSHQFAASVGDLHAGGLGVVLWRGQCYNGV